MIRMRRIRTSRPGQIQNALTNPAAGLVGISLMVAFGLGRRVFLAPQELGGPVPAMVYWILAALVPCTLAGALLAPSRGGE